MLLMSLIIAMFFLSWSFKDYILNVFNSNISFVKPLNSSLSEILENSSSASYMKVSLSTFLNVSDVYDDYQPYLFGLPLPASETMNSLVDLYTEVYTLIVCVFVVVFFLFVETIVKYMHKQFDPATNRYFYIYPIPFSNEEEHFIDTLVIIIPTWIVLHILAPSLGYLYNEEVKFYDVCLSFDVNVIGCQWYWTYEYVIEIFTNVCYSEWNPYVRDDSHSHCTQFIFSFDSIINLEDPEKRLLSVYEPLVLPVNTNILLSFTSRDVIHSWALPQMGIKVDCVPGRITHAIFCSYSMGVFYGQCSELCGVFHGFMPICVEVVTFDHFFIWAVNTYLISLFEHSSTEVVGFFFEKIKQFLKR